MSDDRPSPSSSSIDESFVTGASSEVRDIANPIESDAPVAHDGARVVVGKGMNKFSELINENIIAARYGVFASIALLTVSCISQSTFRIVFEIVKSFEIF